MFDRVAIIGVGLVGGSVGLALKARRLARHVAGVTLDGRSLRAALRARAIDSGSTDLETGVLGASLVVLAAPVGSLPRLARDVLALVSTDCVMTDVGSVKKEVVRAAGRDPRFVPGHPMAGSERSGVEHASAELFEGSVAVLTPARSAAWAIARVALLWRRLGARVVRMSAREHDARAAAASHAPFAAAAAIVDALASKAAALAASGFRDTTRVAASDPALWAEILVANRAEVVRSLGTVRSSLRRIETAVRAGDERRLRSLLARSARARERLGRKLT